MWCPLVNSMPTKTEETGAIVLAVPAYSIVSIVINIFDGKLDFSFH